MTFKMGRSFNMTISSLSRWSSTTVTGTQLLTSRPWIEPTD